MDLNKLLKKLENKLKKFVNKLLAKYLPEATQDTSEQESSSTPNQPDSSSNMDEADFSKFDFCWGGFRGGGAKLDEKAIIKNLNVNIEGNKMTYSWARLWGMEFTEAGALACLFIPEGNKWIGGKFEWISESRTNRSLGNIKEGYNGWSWSKFSASKKFAFVIISGDGKKRTNVIVCSK